VLERCTGPNTPSGEKVMNKQGSVGQLSVGYQSVGFGSVVMPQRKSILEEVAEKCKGKKKQVEPLMRLNSNLPHLKNSSSKDKIN